jgi:hypothetical protein
VFSIRKVASVGSRKNTERNELSRRIYRLDQGKLVTIPSLRMPPNGKPPQPPGSLSGRICRSIMRPSVTGRSKARPREPCAKKIVEVL